MKIWILDSDVDKYENLMLKNEFDMDLLRQLNGDSKSKVWIPLEVKKMYGDRIFSNTPGFSPHLPVIDSKSTEILSDLIKKDSELLPLVCKDAQFNIINVTKVIDCINYEQAEYKTFRDGKRIMRFTKYAFHQELLEGDNIFRIPELPFSRPFVSDKFKNVVEENGLEGFLFELAWDSSAE